MDAVRGGQRRRGSTATALLLRAALASSVLCTGALAGCGGGDDGTSPADLTSQLLPASEFPGFKSERKFEWDNTIDYVGQGLQGRILPESTPPSQAVDAFDDAGFEAGVGDRFVRANGNRFEGPQIAEDVVQLGSDADAREALDYVGKEASKPPCFGVCSVAIRKFAVPGIPGASGIQLTPQRNPPPDAPPPFEAYGVGFTIGPRLFLVDAGGGPGQVNKSQVVDAAKALYQRNAKSDEAS
jgi:hypothetical protein